jgi:hypothetical protein
MPSRKQRQRKLKSKRHEYETVWVDADGNELEEPPSELVEQEDRRKQEKTVAGGAAKNGSKPAPRGARVPQQPSWNRAFKRAALLGVVVFFLFSLTSKSDNRYLAALIPAVIYTAMFVPLTFFIDRFAYRRYQAREAAGGTATRPRPAKKR